MAETEKFDPVDYYSKFLKDRVRKLSSDFIDDLAKKGKVDFAANKVSYRKLQLARAQDEVEDQKRNTFKRWRALVVVLDVISAIVFVIGIIATAYAGSPGGIAALVIGLVLGIGFLILLMAYFRPKLARLEAEDRARQKVIDALDLECFNQLVGMFRLLRWDDFNNIVKKATDMFTIDPSLLEEKFQLLHQKFGFEDIVGPSDSVLGVMSGSIDTNPYIRVKVLNESMVPHTYTGTLVITWTTYSTDSDGHVHSEFHTQTLVAEAVHPAPLYSRSVYTIYGNNAAPDLKFSRTRSAAPYSDQKALDKYVKKREKEMDKRSRKAVASGGSYIPMNNTEFEACWGADVRNNEQQFRLLFTPLAQQNIMELLSNKNRDGYGDDFSFVKRGKVNVVCSDHSQGWSGYNPSSVFGYRSFEEAKKYFVNYISDMFKSLFFDLAPFLCIPLYQTTEAGPFKYEGRPIGAMSDYEAMSVVNGMDYRMFMPKESATEQILHVTYKGHVGKADSFTVKSDAFKAIPRVDYIPTMGGDGNIHDVPVPWKEYIPVSSQNEVTLRPFESEASDESLKRDMGDDFRFDRVGGFLGMLIDSYNEDSENRLSRALGEKSEAERS